MTMFFDAVALDSVRVSRDGYLLAAGKVTPGIQVFLGSEVGRPEMPTVKVYRSESELFSSDTMASFAHRPCTIDHPSELVDSKSWKRLAIGFTAGGVARDGASLRVPLMLADAEVIEAVRAGTRAPSVGYTCQLDWTPGKTADGEAYDARQIGIRASHIGVVDAACAGPACRVGDAPRNSEDNHMEDAARQRDAAWQAYKDSLSTAWRRPHGTSEPVADAGPESYQAYVDRLSTAWQERRNAG
jgi:hypothetical protein